MFHRERAVIGRIFQALPNFCPHRQTRPRKHVEHKNHTLFTQIQNILSTKTTPCSHGFKIYYPQKPHPVHTDSKYTVHKNHTLFTLIQNILSTKTTPCSHGFKIYRPRQTHRLTKLIYMIIQGDIVSRHGWRCSKKLLPRHILHAHEMGTRAYKWHVPIVYHRSKRNEFVCP